MAGLVITLMASCLGQRPCYATTYPPFMPTENARHGETRYLAYGYGAMLCCDGRWGWTPKNTRSVEKIVQDPLNKSVLYAILDPHRRQLDCASSSSSLLTLQANGSSCIPFHTCYTKCEPYTKEDCFVQEGTCSKMGTLCKPRHQKRGKNNFCRAKHGFPDIFTHGACASHSSSALLFSKCCYGEIGIKTKISEKRLFESGNILGVYNTLDDCLNDKCIMVDHPIPLDCSFLCTF